MDICTKEGMVQQGDELALCRHCSEVLRGRVDKRFCDDRCRNAFNNLRKRAEQKIFRAINSILYKNRNILKALHTAGIFRVKKATLLQLGFRFGYHTHRCFPEKGRVLVCCYDHALRPCSRDGYRIECRPVQCWSEAAIS